jgi:hypothetical protein
VVEAVGRELALNFVPDLSLDDRLVLPRVAVFLVDDLAYASGEGRLPGLRRSRDDKCPLRMQMDTIEDDTLY